MHRTSRLTLAVAALALGLTHAAPAGASPNAPIATASAPGRLAPGPQRLHDAGGDDLLLYGFASQPDRLMRSRGDGTHAVSSASVAGAYQRVAPGDFDRDGDTDVILDAAGGVDRYLRSNGDGTFGVGSFSIVGTYADLIPADVDADGDTDLLLYGAGSDPDRLMRSRGDGTFTVSPLSIAGTYEPAAGDIDRDGDTDVVLVGSGSRPDRLLLSRGDGSFSVRAIAAVAGEGTPVPGDYDGDGDGDVLVYPSELLLSNGDGTFRHRPLSFGAQYLPVPIDHDRDGDTDLVLYRPNGSDLLLRSRGDGTFAYSSLSIAGSYVPIPGDFDGTLRRMRGPVVPRLADREIRDLLVAIQPQPGTTVVTSPPSITGDARADARIRAIAEARGYRRRSVSTVPLTGVQGVPLQPAAASALAGMRADAAAVGHSLRPRSGYRSVSDQQGIFLRELRERGSYSANQIAAGAADVAIDDVLRLHSIPGYSRHHSGYAVDLSGPSGGLLQAGSAAEVWLRRDRFAHAMHRGFLPSYPPGGGAQGPVPEAWEYTYVGHATLRCAGWFLPLQDPAARWSCPRTAG